MSIGTKDERCMCGATSEDWRHVLRDCGLYADPRDLNVFGVLTENGKVAFSMILMHRV